MKYIKFILYVNEQKVNDGFRKEREEKLEAFVLFTFPFPSTFPTLIGALPGHTSL